MRETTPFRLDELLDRLRRAAGRIAARKGVAFETRVQPEVPGRLAGDPLRLGRILALLADHAVRRTRQGRVEIEVARVSGEGETVVVRFSVRDTGESMAPEELARLLDPAPEPSAARQDPGLGLPLVRGLVVRIGGRLDAESTPGQGSCCSVTLPFTLPFTLPEDQAPPPAATAPLVADFAGLRLLLVEDNEINLLAALAILERAGVTVETARDGVQALERLFRHPDHYDAVLMDVGLPGLDGHTATRRLRADPRFARLPILALTAHAAPDKVAASLAAGMDGHLTKPIRPDPLFAALARLFPDGVPSRP